MSQIQSLAEIPWGNHWLALSHLYGGSTGSVQLHLVYRSCEWLVTCNLWLTYQQALHWHLFCIRSYKSRYVTGTTSVEMTNAVIWQNKILYKLPWTFFILVISIVKTLVINRLLQIMDFFHQHTPILFVSLYFIHVLSYWHADLANLHTISFCHNHGNYIHMQLKFVVLLCSVLRKIFLCAFWSLRFY